MKVYYDELIEISNVAASICVASKEDSEVKLYPIDSTSHDKKIKKDDIKLYVDGMGFYIGKKYYPYDLEGLYKELNNIDEVPYYITYLNHYFYGTDKELNDSDKELIHGFGEQISNLHPIYAGYRLKDEKTISEYIEECVPVYKKLKDRGGLSTVAIVDFKIQDMPLIGIFSKRTSIYEYLPSSKKTSIIAYIIPNLKRDKMYINFINYSNNIDVGEFVRSIGGYGSKMCGYLCISEYDFSNIIDNEEDN